MQNRRMRALAVLGWAAMLVIRAVAAPLPLPPDEIYGRLFVDVQRSRVFPDQKTFPDCVPRGEPARIVAEFLAAGRMSGPDALRGFVERHFIVPEAVIESPAGPPAPLRQHLDALWDRLRRAPDVPVPGSSLLPLPNAYVVPGGRFREVYYWDSYFTMLGLRVSGRDDLIESMVANFAHELQTFGLIPNGNRTYYLSRSQPPFFALMVELLAEHRGEAAYREYRSALKAEYAYWTDRRWPTHHGVVLPDAVTLSRYWDREDRPRDEAFALDEAAVRGAARPAPAIYRDLRSAAESGWDFSSRWLADPAQLASIRTTELVPVDLNSLLWQLEQTLSRAEAAVGNTDRAAELRSAARRRAAALRSLCWSESDGFFCDFDLATTRRSPALTLAGVAPLFVGLATPEQARRAAETLRRRFLRPGGLVTSLVRTGQQWDAPNGWAPLEWMAVAGLERYGEVELAAEIARRWMALNEAVYARTGRLMEKYDVEDLDRPAGGGEYPGQDGFGWTNGVLLRLMQEYPAARLRPDAEAPARPAAGPLYK